MLKHFGIWPYGLDKENLFYEQKVFLLYLMGYIPSNEDWKLQVEYKIELKKIDDLDIKDIDVPQGDIDLAKLQDRDVSKFKKERLIQEKEKRKRELDERYGIERKKEEQKRPEGLPEYKPEEDNKMHPKELWEILEGKGLLKPHA